MPRRPPSSRNAFTITTLGGMALILLQCAIEASVENVACSVITVAMATMTFSYCLRPAVLQRHPLSSLAIIGYNVTSMTLALLAQSFSFKPIIFNLQNPFKTFAFSAILQIVLIAAHLFYAKSRTLIGLQQAISSKVLIPLGIFKKPSNIELWILGLFGLSAIWYSQIINVGDIEYGDAGGKFLQALLPLAAAPFLIPLRSEFSCTRARPVRPMSIILLSIYFLILIVTGVAGNARSFFSTVALIFLLAAILMIGMQRLIVKPRAKMIIIAITIISLPAMNIASDLANAMVIARQSRSNVGFIGMIKATVEAFEDKDRLNEETGTWIVMSGFNYSEYYISNPFIQRLTYTKYTDIMVNASDRLGENQIRIVREEFKQQLLSIFPTPLLRIAGVNLDKSTTAHSAGDIYDSLAYGSDSSGFRVGSSIVNSKDVLGIWWIPGMFLIFIAAVWSIDLMGLRTIRGIILSPLAFISLYTWFTRELITDSLSQTIGIITRGTIQSIFIYASLFFLARILASLIAPPRVANTNLSEVRTS